MSEDETKDNYPLKLIPKIHSEFMLFTQRIDMLLVAHDKRFDHIEKSIKELKADKEKLNTNEAGTIKIIIGKKFAVIATSIAAAITTIIAWLTSGGVTPPPGI